MAKKFIYERYEDELLARGGTFDLTGTTAKVNAQFWGFNASDGAVLEAIKGIPVNSTHDTLAKIRAAETGEEDISGAFLTAVTDPLFAGVLYRADGYIITSVKLTSGSLHLFKTLHQVSA